jgi:hypothetical protein
MADKPQHDNAQTSEPARDAGAIGRKAAQAATDVSREGVRVGQATGETFAQAGEAAAQTTRRSAEAGEEAVRRISNAAGETVRRGGQAMADGQHQIVEEAAERFQDLGRKTAELVQTASEDLRLLVTLPTAGGGLQDLQQTMAGLVEGVIRTNVQATQELFRLADPTKVVELQQRFVRDYFGTWIESAANLTRAVRRGTGETLGQLEQQLEQRRQRVRERKDARQHQAAAE